MAYTAAHPGDIMKGTNQPMDAVVASQEQGAGGDRRISPATARYRDGVAFAPGEPMTSTRPN